MGLRMNYNRITDETSIGVVFEPSAATAARDRSGQQIERLREVGR
jgi:hypothetical protein